MVMQVHNCDNMIHQTQISQSYVIIIVFFFHDFECMYGNFSLIMQRNMSMVVQINLCKTLDFMQWIFDTLFVDAPEKQQVVNQIVDCREFRLANIDLYN